MMGEMHTRAVTVADIPLLTRLQVRHEESIGGGEIISEVETAEQLDHVDDLASSSLVVEDDGGGILGAAWRWGTNTVWLVDPDAEDETVHDVLLGWLEDGPIRTADADAADSRSVAALDGRGWHHVHSSFDLEMDQDQAMALEEPAWAEGVTTVPWTPSVAADVHELIYVRAGWSTVPGHNQRPFEEWSSLFAGAFLVPGQQVLAVEGEELVGVAMCRIWDDGTGWVSQLAVARAHRARGIGRALLLTALRRLRDDGATSLGLSVNAENRGALGLYQRVGLTVHREWLTYEVTPSATPSSGRGT